MQAEAQALLDQVFGAADPVPALEHAPDSLIDTNDTFIDHMIDHSGEPIEV